MKTDSMKNAPLKKLSLNKETIRSLSAEELDGVAGGTTWTVSILTAGVAGVAIAYVAAKM